MRLFLIIFALTTAALAILTPYNWPAVPGNPSEFWYAATGLNPPRFADGFYAARIQDGRAMYCEVDMEGMGYLVGPAFHALPESNAMKEFPRARALLDELARNDPDDPRAKAYTQWAATPGGDVHELVD